MSVDLSVLSPGFAGFAALGHNSVRQKLDAVEVADDPGGEIRFYIREREPKVFVLSRAERSQEERVIMWSPDPVDLERYLTMEIGDHIRETRGLGRIYWPFWPDDMVANLTPVHVEPEVIALQDRSGRVLPPRFQDSGNPQPAVRFSSLVAGDVAVMRKSLLDPAGLPLYTLRSDCSLASPPEHR